MELYRGSLATLPSSSELVHDAKQSYLSFVDFTEYVPIHVMTLETFYRSLLIRVFPIKFENYVCLLSLERLILTLLWLFN